MWNGEIFVNAHKILIKYHYLYVDNVITAGGRGLLCCIINKRFKSVQIKSASKTYSKFCENILKIGTSRAANDIVGFSRNIRFTKFVAKTAYNVLSRILKFHTTNFCGLFAECIKLSCNSSLMA